MHTYYQYKNIYIPLMILSSVQWCAQLFLKDGDMTFLTIYYIYSQTTLYNTIQQYLSPNYPFITSSYILYYKNNLKGEEIWPQWRAHRGEGVFSPSPYWQLVMLWYKSYIIKGKVQTMIFLKKVWRDILRIINYL